MNIIPIDLDDETIEQIRKYAPFTMPLAGHTVRVTILEDTDDNLQLAIESVNEDS